MAVKIRLRRMGKRDQAAYRIVVADESAKRDGKVIETVGWYHPQQKKSSIDKQKIEAWVKKGAQCTEAVASLLA